MRGRMTIGRKVIGRGGGREIKRELLRICKKRMRIVENRGIRRGLQVKKEGKTTMGIKIVKEQESFIRF